jgi:hypothetical protein
VSTCRICFELPLGLLAVGGVFSEHRRSKASEGFEGMCVLEYSKCWVRGKVVWWPAGQVLVTSLELAGVSSRDLGGHSVHTESCQGRPIWPSNNHRPMASCAVKYSSVNCPVPRSTERPESKNP